MNDLDRLHEIVTASQLHAVSSNGCLPSEIAFRAVGLHAARTKTPHMTLTGRRACASGKTNLTPPNLSPLVKAPLMRSTLHYVLEEEFPALHSATVDYRLARRYRSLKRIGFDETSIGELRRRLAHSISSEGLCESELVQLARNQLSVIQTSWGGRTEAHVAWQLCRLLWDNGDIRMINTASDWREEQRYFRPWQVPRLAKADAVSHMVLRYVTAYGPVTIKDVAWWTALDAKTLRQCLDALVATDSIVKISHEERTWYATPGIDKRSDKAQENSIIFLAYEDPFIKAYFDTRERYATSFALSRLFYGTGEAKASVLLSGKVRGIWEVSPRNDFARLTLCPSLSRFDRARIVDAWEEHLLVLCGVKQSCEVTKDTYSYSKR